MPAFIKKNTMKTCATNGTCSRAIDYEVADGVLTACRFVGGCPDNTPLAASMSGVTTM